MKNKYFFRLKKKIINQVGLTEIIRIFFDDRKIV